VIYGFSMNSDVRPSPSIIVAAIAAILCSLALAAFSTFMLLTTSRTNLAEMEPATPWITKGLLDVVWIFCLAVGAYIFFCGIGIMRLRRWARISLMIIGGFMLFFGLAGVIVAWIALVAMPLPGPPGVNAIIAGLLVLVYGTPIALAVWWLILFTRRSVVAQFDARRATLPSGLSIQFRKPGCPLPISIVGWFSLMTVLNLVILSFLPFSIPVVLFSRVLHGMIAYFLLAFLAAALIASGIGLLRLQRWSHPFNLSLQVLYTANLLVTILSPAYPGQVRAMLAEMHLPAMPPGVPDFLKYAPYISLAGILMPLGCAFCLLYWREAFFRAARPNSEANYEIQST
jgi:hypothetical protein